MTKTIPVIDLFAGPGGLGEGFESFLTETGNHPFRIRLSIEKDPIARKTLLMRAFYRQFNGRKVSDEYYRYLRNPNRTEADRDALFELFPTEAEAAQEEAWCAELGKQPAEDVKRRITNALRGAETWALIGGPPCQAYSLVGRSRMKGPDEVSREKFEKDARHYLYREYLKIIVDHEPPVFVLENVKGLLSSTVQGERIFDKIRRDLERPGVAMLKDSEISGGQKQELSYRIYPLVRRRARGDYKPSDFVVRAEELGVPQARHRVILIGVRSDYTYEPDGLTPSKTRVSVHDVIKGLPKLRSSLSKEKDSQEAWREVLLSIKKQDWFGVNYGVVDEQFWRKMWEVLDEIAGSVFNTGAEFIDGGVSASASSASELHSWYFDGNLKGVCNHSTRGHMREDLYRYLFAACFADIYEQSPELSDYPEALLPKHENVEKALKGSMFSDRFRVQLWEKPATTVTSHISKDGHYFIHPDPTQCRSLTVREAARLQTFPDNYLFEGPRTAQYHQVGNAVPPFLAKQIAGVVYGVLMNPVNAQLPLDEREAVLT